LNFHSPQTRGWQSPRFCEYPQEIGLQFTDGGVGISQVQLLSHQSKIASRIELFMGHGPDYFSCQFTRLGYLSLDSNERSSFKARELKSVYLKAKGGFMKLLMHKCHINSLNLQNQVGLIAINILGAPAAPRGGGGYPQPLMGATLGGGAGGGGYGAAGGGYGGPPAAGSSMIPRPGGGGYGGRCVGEPPTPSLPAHARSSHSPCQQSNHHHHHHPLPPAGRPLAPA